MDQDADRYINLLVMVNTFESIDYILSICYHLFYMIKLLLYNLYVYIYNEFTLIVAISLGLQIYWKMAWTNLKDSKPQGSMIFPQFVV